MKLFLLFSFIVFSLQSINAQRVEQYTGDILIFKSVSVGDNNREIFHLLSKTKNEEKEFTSIPENYKTLISIGFGYNRNDNYRNNFILSFDIIPKIAKNFLLDIKIDGIKEGLTYNTLLNIIPEYKLDLTKKSELSGYFGIGPTIFFYPKGHPGLDASITGQIKIEYSFETFFINSELRKPVYFYEDSGHIGLILNLNFGIKI